MAASPGKEAKLLSPTLIVRRWDSEEGSTGFEGGGDKEASCRCRRCDDKELHLKEETHNTTFDNHTQLVGWLQLLSVATLPYLPLPHSRSMCFTFATLTRRLAQSFGYCYRSKWSLALLSGNASLSAGGVHGAVATVNGEWCCGVDLGWGGVERRQEAQFIKQHFRGSAYT